MAWSAPILERGTGTHPPVANSSGVPYRSFQTLHNGNDLPRFRFRFRINGTVRSFSESASPLRAGRCILYRLNLPLLCGSPHIAVCVKL